MRILVKEKGSIISDVTLERGPVEIGSKPDCALHLPDMRVNHTQALLSPLADGGWLAVHLGGTAKTLVNGRVLRDPVRISNGDQITIEDYDLHVYIDLDEKHRQPARSDASHAAAKETAPQYPLPFGAVTRSLRERLTMSPGQVDGFAQFALRLGPCTDLAAVMEAVVDSLLLMFKARATWIGIRRSSRGALEYIQGRDYQSNVFDVPKFYSSLLNRCVDRGMAVWVPRVDQQDTTAVIASPLTSSHGRLGFVYVESKKDGPELTEQDFEHLIAMATAVGRQLDTVLGEHVRWQKAVTSAEQSVVHAIQSQLDPKSVPEWPDLQVAAHSSPGAESAGDIYDIMQLPNGAAAFFVGSVAAKPVTAAVTMIEARTTFRIAVMRLEMPHVMMQSLNWLLCTRPEKVHMQCGIVLLDPRNGAVLHSMAGPSSGVIIGQSGSPRRLDNVDAPFLGTTPDYAYLTRKGLLGKGEALALFTPGVGRVQNSAGQELQESQFLESLCDGFGMAARKALEETLSDISAYAQGGYQPRDLTLLLARRGQTEA